MSSSVTEIKEMDNRKIAIQYPPQPNHRNRQDHQGHKDYADHWYHSDHRALMIPMIDGPVFDDSGDFENLKLNEMCRIQ